MRRFVKLALLSLFGLGCLVLNTDAKQLPPPAPAIPFVPPPLIYPNPPKSTVWQPNQYAVLQSQRDTAVLDNGQTFTFNFDPADSEAKKLAKQLSEAKTDSEKDKLKEKLKELLTKQFDERQQRHVKELEALDAQVKKLKEMVGKRQENKKDIIDERTKQLGREAAGLGW